jgi:peptide/nickel transport system permease protein
MPQTLWVVGTAYVVGDPDRDPDRHLFGLRQYSVFDQAGTFVTMVGFSVPPFFSGPLVIVIFSVKLGWFPSIYDTTHEVVDWDSFKSCSSADDHAGDGAGLADHRADQPLHARLDARQPQPGLRAHRPRQGPERADRGLVHVLRNSMIPVVTVIALGIPSIFGGAIITEQVFKVNGIGQLLITAIQANDLPMVQTLTFIFAVLIVLFNLIADILYGCSTRGSAMTETTPDREPIEGLANRGPPAAQPMVGCLGPVQEAPRGAMFGGICF